MYILRALLGSPSRKLLAQIKSELNWPPLPVPGCTLSRSRLYVWDVMVRAELHGSSPLKSGSAQLLAMLCVLFLLPDR